MTFVLCQMIHLVTGNWLETRGDWMVEEICELLWEMTDPLWAAAPAAFVIYDTLVTLTNTSLLQAELSNNTSTLNFPSCAKKHFQFHQLLPLPAVKYIFYYVKFDIQCWNQSLIFVEFKATKCQLKVDHAKGLQNWSRYLTIFIHATNTDIEYIE